jgi:pentatricopeptide repeat protein
MFPWQWEQFSEHKLRPDVISWSIRLKAHASRYDVQEAWNVWQKMRDAGITPAEQTWVSLIAAHGKPRGVKKCRADDRVMQVGS